MYMMTSKIRLALIVAVLSTGSPLSVSLASDLAVTKTWAGGEVLLANDLNTNFTDTETAVNSKQNRVTGTCSGTAITAINANGTVACATTLVNGITSVDSSPLTGLVSTYTDKLQISVNVPADGYVHVIATGMINLTGKTNASVSDFASVYVGVTNSAGTSPLSGNYTRFSRSGTDATGDYSIPYTAQAVFQVLSGTRFFYLTGKNDGGSGTASLWYNRIVVTYHGSTM